MSIANTLTAKPTAELKARANALNFYYGNDDLVHEPATVEGGDVLVIGNGAVMIGMGERTTPQGVEFLAREYFRSGQVTKVIAVELPSSSPKDHSVLTEQRDEPSVQRVIEFLVDRLQPST